MQPWWERLPERLLEEDAALHLLSVGDNPIVRRHRWTRTDGEPRLRVELNLGTATELEVRFPAHYPDGCPSVRPVPYASLSSHQFLGTGVLCLELGPDNWHPCFRAAEMIQSAWILLAKETIRAVAPETVDIPSRHVARLGDEVRQASGVLVTTKDFEAAVGATTRATEFEFVWPMRNLLRVFPVSWPKEKGLVHLPPALRDETKWTGVFVPLGEEAPESPPIEPEPFRTFVKEFGGVVITDAERLVVLRWPSGTWRAFFVKDKVRSLKAVPWLPDESQRTPAAVADAVGRAKVGIVGLGSIGSKVAVSLARTGLQRFVLVDGDVFLGENVCRHQASFADVAAVKVDVARELIRDVSAEEPEIDTWQVDIASSTNPDVHAAALEALASADLIVDASASPEVFCLLAMLASDRKVPLVWGEVFAGGDGALLATARPGADPCPRCVRAAFLAASREWPPAPNAHAPRRYEAEAGDGAPHVATDADVALVAAVLTRRVLDVLSGRDDLSCISLLGLRSGWIFKAPMQSIVISARADDWSCPRCWTPSSAAEKDAAQRAEALFRSDPSADDPPST